MYSVENLTHPLIPKFVISTYNLTPFRAAFKNIKPLFLSTIETAKFHLFSMSSGSERSVSKKFQTSCGGVMNIT